MAILVLFFYSDTRTREAERQRK